ncbi:hypothetical protein [Isoptericola rhizosphaerae]|uniref:hypothetical protein n=1 Tax=Isoptericola rhizosphaerae TaxID=3377837 RepID=UPI00383AEB31
MTFSEKLTDLSAETEAKVVAINAAYSSGEITHDEAVAAIAAAVGRGNVRAVSLADLALAASLMVALRRPVATLGLSLPTSEPARLRKAATTLLATQDVTPERVARLGRAEPLQTGQRAFSRGLTEHRGTVVGWTRNLEPSACELCQHWARSGDMFPIDAPMATHPGCACTQTIHTKETA